MFKLTLSSMMVRYAYHQKPEIESSPTHGNHLRPRMFIVLFSKTFKPQRVKIFMIDAFPACHDVISDMRERDTFFDGNRIIRA